MAKKKAAVSKLNWYAKIHIFELVALPAYRRLSKGATDVLTVAIAKSDAAGAVKSKGPGRPIFGFTFADAVRTLNMPAQTFNTALEQLKEVGFISVNRPGGIGDGDGIPTLYQLSDGYKTWIAPPRDNTNILKAQAAKRAKREALEASADPTGV
jgi:hypothetical protein